ncbi:MAG: helix-turn-helix transcriptional regulator [Deltaproteobacteria bacterium]|nr:helix-turn-helix transcriptional regulator [Deltaproteobacteria bacterium]MBW2687127.1 helix-turn-helix transcriptional regulator [Deltaproteobacteria bacterium]
MLPPQHVALRVVDAAYDLESHPEPWLRGLLESGEEVLDQGLGCAAVAVAGLTGSGEPLVSRVVTHGDATDSLALRLARASRSVQVDRALTVSGGSTSVVRTLSAVSSEAPHLHHAVRHRVGCKDVLCLLAVDSELYGVLLLSPAPGRISLSATAEKRWRTLASHIGAADRLRRALGRSNQERLIPLTSLPRELKAEIPSDTLASAPSGLSLRDAAAHVDSESRRGPKGQTTQALEVLRGLVDGELSMIDWFVRNGRRFALARRSDPSLGDPRALTAKEQQVVIRTARGESRKLVAYHMGISRSRVSKLLGPAMRKLCVKNQAELVMKVRCLERHGLLHDY